MNKLENDILTTAKEVIEKEAHAVESLKSYLNSTFCTVIQLIYKSGGRLIVTGIGKSAIIANKIVATLNSTGTHSVFMHAADAIHGDLGIIKEEDIVICISKSGNTPEIKMLVPLIKRMGNPLVAMVSNTTSFLAQHADYTIQTTVESEACPNNLAPTTSTTTQLVMGDAIAVTLLKLRGFTKEDFAKLHPGGSLGKKLYMRVGDILDNARRPFVKERETISDTIFNISANRLGATAVLDKDETLMGIITDGDIRRMLQQGRNPGNLRASDIMTKKPKTIEVKELAYKAFTIMEKNKITSVVVLDNGKYKGLIHIHDIIREGIV
jgi:arabinose-5-phosphate isomerase